MSDVFVISNQHGHYWGKAKLWVDGSDPRAVLRVRHRDEAVNSLVELSSRDVTLRGQVVAAGLDSRGNPSIEPSQTPLPVARGNNDGSAEHDDEENRPASGPALSSTSSETCA
jgi:hypothetical protein